MTALGLRGDHGWKWRFPGKWVLNTLELETHFSILGLS